MWTPRAKTKAWSRPLADFVGSALDPLAAKRGFGESDILIHWAAIAGERLAAVCEPIRLQWPVRAPRAEPGASAEPATLHLRVESAFALELQHLAPVICERVNARLGWRCVGRIMLKQGPLERVNSRPQKPPPPDSAMLAEAETMTAEVKDPGLRESLKRLGAQLLARRETG